MSGTRQLPADYLLPYGSVEGALTVLRATGLVIVRAVNWQAFLSLLTDVGEIREHPHADTDGVTVIYPGARDGHNTLAFTRLPLLPHTDGTAAAEPPELLAVHCMTSAREGGDLLLTDGSEVVRSLQRAGWRSDQIADGLFLRWSDGRSTRTILERMRDGSVTIRYRDDQIAGPVGDPPHLASDIRTIISDRTFAYPLRADDAYILNNRRWLHGRTAFTGHRVVKRVLLQRRRGTSLIGFGMGGS